MTVVEQALNFCPQFLFAENTGKLHIEDLRVPNPFIFGSAAELRCEYSWGDGRGAGGDDGIYSIKWFKDSEEFYRYNKLFGVPSSKFSAFSVPNVSISTLTICKQRFRPRPIISHPSSL